MSNRIPGCVGFPDVGQFPELDADRQQASDGRARRRAAWGIASHKGDTTSAYLGLLCEYGEGQYTAYCRAAEERARARATSRRHNAVKSTFRAVVDSKHIFRRLRDFRGTLLR